MKLQKINSVFKKYSTLVMTSLLLLTKKEKIPNTVLYAIISIIGYLLLDQSTSTNKLRDWKDFIGDNKNNDKNDDKIDDFDDENNNSDDEENDDSNIKTNIKKIKEIIKTENDFNGSRKLINKVIDKDSEEREYSDYLTKINVDYHDSSHCLFKLKVNENNKNIPIFNLRSSEKIDFYWNFHLHNTNNSKINSLILCRDIHQWMSNSSISNEDLENRCYPLYLIFRDHKSNNEIMIFEAYKIFVYCDETGNKQAFISKGENFKTIEEILNILINLGYIKDLLNEKEYDSYNLTSHHSVILFLNNLLSHFLPYESKDGEVINIDLQQYNENKNTFDYFYHTNIMDNDILNTNI